MGNTLLTTMIQIPLHVIDCDSLYYI